MQLGRARSDEVLNFIYKVSDSCGPNFFTAAVLPRDPPLARTESARAGETTCKVGDLSHRGRNSTSFVPDVI